MSADRPKDRGVYRSMERTLDVEVEISRKDLPHVVKRHLEFEKYFIINKTRITKIYLGSQGELYKFDILQQRMWQLNNADIVSEIKDFKIIYHPEDDTISKGDLSHYKYPVG